MYYYYYGPRYPDEIVTVLGLVGGAPGGKTQRVRRFIGGGREPLLSYVLVSLSRVYHERCAYAIRTWD